MSRANTESHNSWDHPLRHIDDRVDRLLDAALEVYRLSGTADQLYDGPGHDFCEKFPCHHQEFTAALDALGKALSEAAGR